MTLDELRRNAIADTPVNRREDLVVEEELSNFVTPLDPYWKPQWNRIFVEPAKDRILRKRLRQMTVVLTSRLCDCRVIECSLQQ